MTPFILKLVQYLNYWDFQRLVLTVPSFSPFCTAQPTGDQTGERRECETQTKRKTSRMAVSSDGLELCPRLLPTLPFECARLTRTFFILLSFFFFFFVCFLLRAVVCGWSSVICPISRRAKSDVWEQFEFPEQQVKILILTNKYFTQTNTFVWHLLTIYAKINTFWWPFSVLWDTGAHLIRCSHCHPGFLEHRRNSFVVSVSLFPSSSSILGHHHYKRHVTMCKRPMTPSLSSCVWGFFSTRQCSQVNQCV